MKRLPGTLAAAIFAWLCIQPGPAAADPFVRVQGEQFVLNGQVYKIKGTNYYPRDGMWAAMWSSFNPSAITADAQRMHDLGLNAVRILVPYSNGGWGGPSVSQSKIDQLVQVVQIMGDQGIRSVVTLFDWETSFPAAGTSTEANHLTYLNAIVMRLKDNPYVLMWDVKNEPDHPSNYGSCDCNPGACGDWDCKPAKRDQIVSWLHRMCDAVRARDPNHPVSAGMRWWANLSDVLAFQDVAIFHSYWPNISTQEIPETKAAMGTNLKPILVEEWGWPTNPSPCNRDGQMIYDYSETQQYNLYVSHLTAFQQHDIAGGLQWMTYDAKAYTTNANESFEQYFGLWRYDYSLKPAAIYYRDNMPVAQFPPVAMPTGSLASFTATAGKGEIAIAWTSGIVSSYAGTVVRYSTTAFPNTPEDGTPLCDIPGQASTTYAFTQTNAVPGVTYYYSAFPYNFDREYGPRSTTTATLLIHADFDGDGDVDLSDYAHLQVCLSGAYEPQNDTACQNTLLDKDADVDADDLAVFRYCLAGSMVAPPAGCAH